MGDFDLTFIEAVDAGAGAPGGVVITASSTINTKGAYTELFSNTSGDTVFIQLDLIPTSTNITNALLDIATGAAASEVNFIENIKTYSDSGNNLQSIPMTLDLIVPVASGARLSARMQAAVSSDTLELVVKLFSSTFTFDSFSSTTWGADTSNSRGTFIPDPGGTVNTFGAFTEIISSTPEDTTHLIICFGNNGNLAFGVDFDWTYQIATGAAASEVVALPSIFIRSSSAEIITPFAIVVPFLSSTGTRLSVNCKCNGNQATDRLLDLVVIGLNSSVTAAGGGGGGIAQIVGQGGIVG